MHSASHSSATPSDFSVRLQKFADELSNSGIDTAFVSPGPDLRYLVGYDAVPLERLTALVVRPGRDPILLAPLLERDAALASPVGALGLEVVTWAEGSSPYARLRDVVGTPTRFAVDPRMWAEKLLGLQREFGAATALSAGPALAALRRVKSAAEVESLRRAGAAIDRVHAAVPALLRAGRSEREIGRDIAELIISEGHVRVDFVIVASGPNSASPHHEVSDRVLQVGEPVVVDIGGTMPDGYCSDSTRTYHLGEPSADYARDFETLHLAQQSATRAVRPGATCESIDEAARAVLRDAGLAEFFIHRVGHGIGLETHEEPYMIAGNSLPISPGFAFSIEPGFYRSGVAGARIEDIVVCGESEADVLNLRPRELVLV